MSDQRELIEQLFEAALALEPQARAPFLDEACRRYPNLRGAVEDLLALDEQAGSFLKEPADCLNRMTASLAGAAAQSGSNHENGSSPSPPSGGRLRPGDVLVKRFVIVRFIAHGGMGEVYEAEDRFLQGVHVAVKTILPSMAEDPSFKQRFEREVMLAQQVTHANLCPLYAIFHHEQPPPSLLFLTMKLLAGETLAARLHRLYRFSGEETLAIVRQLAAGMLAIHEAGIIHRDIKPTNIMLEGTGAGVRLWITDFGLARAFEPEITAFSKGQVAGTPAYLAPELFMGCSPSRATDLFALGVVVHEIVTGQKPRIQANSHCVLPIPLLKTSDAPSTCVQLAYECLNDDPDRRCHAFERALASFQLRTSESGSYNRPMPLWTRRSFSAAAAAACVGAWAAWWVRDDFEDWIHPLPQKRFVALLGWPPTTDARIKPTVLALMEAIGNELARAEAYDHNLLVILRTTELTTQAQLNEVCESLGANLILATSVSALAKDLKVYLQILEPSSAHPLRTTKIRVPLDQQVSLPAKVVRAAAQLLNVSGFQPDDRRSETGTSNLEALAAFRAAEAFMNQPDFTGVEAAIEKYKQAVVIDSRYALAYARLALAYSQLYFMHRNASAIVLGKANAETSVALDRDLIEGHVSLAWLFEDTGDRANALREMGKALTLDPANPKTLIYQAQIFSRMNRWEDADNVFKKVLMKRPNYWLAWNERGWNYYSQGRYLLALEAFKVASFSAPKNAFALYNVGSLEFRLGRPDEALECLRKSMAAKPNDNAASTMAEVFRSQRKYAEALQASTLAVNLNPSDSTNWLEFGDCSSLVHGHSADAKAAYAHAVAAQEEQLLTNPTRGPDWMLLALYKVKTGKPSGVPSLIDKAESLNAMDIDSQLYKARILELLGERDKALATLALCMAKGATRYQIESIADLESLRKDERYLKLVSNGLANTVGQNT